MKTIDVRALPMMNSALLSPRIKHIKDVEKNISFPKFLRNRGGQMPLQDQLALLQQPKPLVLRRDNLLQTFGCTPGPGIRENAKLMMATID